MTKQEILDKLEEIKDGMDISLCALNLKSNQLQWAGANNPLWVIRNGSDVVEVYKGDNQPIGRYTTSDSFKNHIIAFKHIIF